MMSKQSEAKTAQGYRKESACCKTCKNFASKFETLPTGWRDTTYIKEKNKQCAIGGFAVQSTAHCLRFERMA